jgi:hypothetical protein
MQQNCCISQFIKTCLSHFNQACPDEFSSLDVQSVEFRNGAKELTLTREEKPDGLGLRQSSAALGT